MWTQLNNAETCFAVSSLNKKKVGCISVDASAEIPLEQLCPENQLQKWIKTSSTCLNQLTSEKEDESW